MDYPLGTSAVATVRNVKNLNVLRVKVKSGLGWAHKSVPELGLDATFTKDEHVRDIEIINNQYEVERAPYDVSTLTPWTLEEALVEILGEGEEGGHDYYNEFTGINAFYHMLAGTQPYPEYNKLSEAAKVTSDGVIDVAGLGTFTRLDKVTEYMSQSGDADTFVVFEFAGKSYKKQSYLDSYEGGVWDGTLHEVKPVEKTITVWEKV